MHQGPSDKHHKHLSPSTSTGTLEIVVKRAQLLLRIFSGSAVACAKHQRSTGILPHVQPRLDSPGFLRTLRTYSASIVAIC